MYFTLSLAVWAAFDFTAAAIVMGLLTLVMPVIWFKLRMVISVDSELRIDRAHIELKYLTRPRTLDKDEYQKLRSVNSDARSFHATRPWVKSGVQIFVNDARDKTTYWLIGSRNPAALVSALQVD